MTRKRDQEIVTALDIGTSKVAAIVAAVDEDLQGIGDSGIRLESVAGNEARIGGQYRGHGAID